MVLSIYIVLYVFVLISIIKNKIINLIKQIT